jgi:hypothetical protein
MDFPQMEPFSDDIKETRDDPALMDATLHWPEYREQMRAQKNFFYTIINQDDPRDTSVCRYKTDPEPWLFDRASSMFVLYFRSGFFTPLREALRNTQFYFNHINSSGFFDLKAGDDAKYSYNECMAYTYWLTCDSVVATKIATATRAFDGVRSRWTPQMNFWTERHSGFKLLANIVAFEVLGGAYKDSVLKIADDFQWLQDGADGQIPSAGIDGGLYHYGRQHDWDWAEDTLGASPWMSIFVMDPMLRVYGCSESPAAGKFITRMATFLKASCAVTSYNGSDGTPMDFPRYAIPSGYYLSLLLGEPDTSLRGKAQSLYATYDDGVNEWIRPAGPESGLPAYRVAPWRKYNWEYRPSGGLSWCMGQDGSTTATSLFSAPNAHVPPACTIVLHGTRLMVYSAQRIKAEISEHDLLGRHVQRLYSGWLDNGATKLPFDHSRQASSCRIVKVEAATAAGSSAIIQP